MVKAREATQAEAPQAQQRKNDMPYMTSNQTGLEYCSMMSMMSGRMM